MLIRHSDERQGQNMKKDIGRVSNSKSNNRFRGEEASCK